MVFRRRDRRSWWQIVAHSIWPRGGWGRAAQYVQHRLRRLPDRPHRIARGIFAGVFVSFTPFYGFHFIAAALVAKAMRGNILAALLSTFFGNPLTFPLIAWSSMRLGNWILGTRYEEGHSESLARKFGDAAGDLWHNFGALFTHATANWEGLDRFYREVFLPYLVGGIVPGIIAGTIAMHISLPLITAYQNRRRNAIERKFQALRAAATAKAGAPKKAADPQG